MNGHDRSVSDSLAARRAGCVQLVGAGPGDPGLLTLRALECLREADVVVYDRLVSAAVLALAPVGTAKMYVGKTPGSHPFSQHEINQQLVKLARAGHTVARLKGGDPFMFGRGGEEALHLRAHGIAYEVVPGVTSAAACAAYCGIPLTHRGIAQGVQFVTGHCRAGQPLDLDWQHLADPAFTVVFYMGLATVAQLRAGLLAAGRAPSTPVAVIERGTQPSQRSWSTTLDSLAALVEARDISAPALIIVGEVTSLAAQLAWRESIPGLNETAALQPMAVGASG